MSGLIEWRKVLDHNTESAQHSVPAALGFVRFVGEVRGGAAYGVSVKRKPDRT
jgi:hypothetical protein